MTSASVRTKRLTAQTLLLAILILQDFIPALGNIPIGPLSLTTLQITVMIGAVVMGPNTGMLLSQQSTGAADLYQSADRDRSTAAGRFGGWLSVLVAAQGDETALGIDDRGGGRCYDQYAAGFGRYLSVRAYASSC